MTSDRAAAELREPPVAEPDIGSAGWKGTDRYEIIRRVGEGGMGVVHEAFDRERQTRVALKTLLHYDAAALYLFKREFRTIADVQHTNLVHLHELVVTGDGQAFFTMELVRGTDFVQYTRRSRAPSGSEPPSSALLAASPAEFTPALPQTAADVDRLRAALRQVVSGLDALHSAGKLHRDIKPSNVLVAHDGRVVILDFGVATEISNHCDAGPSESGEVVGTARYMAPEQLDDAPPTPASDWYSVGVMLYEALTGRPPFAGTIVEVMTLKSNLVPPPPSSLVQGVPADLDSLCHDLLRIDPSSRPTIAEIRRRLDIVNSAPPPTVQAGDEATAFIGRDPQLQALRDAFAAVNAGRPLLVRVVGESGMGKTTIVSRFLEELGTSGDAVVLRGRAYEREAVPFKAIDAAIDALSRQLTTLELAGELPSLPADIVLLARMFPVLRRVDTIRDLAAVAQPERGSRRRAFRALAELLNSVAGSKSLVLYIDDAHWGDTDSVALLVDLLRRPGTSPLMLVLTQWDGAEQDYPFLVELRNRWPANADVREVEIGPLADDDARRLALTLLDGTDDLSQKIADAVAREARGSPFLVEELVRGNRGLTPTSASGHLGVLTLSQLVGDRLERLTARARRLVEIVAVEGRPLPLTTLARALAIEDAALPAPLALATARRFTRTGLHNGRDTVEITHNRIRETVLAQLSAAALREIHERLALILEETPETDAEVAARHWFSAGDTERAVRLAEGAVDQAAAKLAVDQGSRLLRLILEHTPPSAPEAYTRRLRLAEMLRFGARHAESAKEYTILSDAAPPEQRVDLQRAASEQLLASGRIDEGAEILRAVLKAVGMRAPRTPLGAYLLLGFYRICLAIIGLKYKERAPESIPHEDHLRIEALCTVATGFGMVNTTLAACMQARHFIEALRKGSRAQVGRAACLESAHVASSGLRAKAREHELFALARSIAKQEGTPYALAYADMALATGLHMKGRWREARDTLMRWTEAQGGGALAHPRILVASAFFYMGEIDESRARFERLHVEAEDRGDLYALVNLRTTFEIRAALLADDPERARRGVRDALASWTKEGFLLQHWQALVYSVDIDLHAGNAARGYEAFVSQLPAVKKSFMLRSVFVRTVTRYAHGRAALGAGWERPETLTTRVAEARKLAAQLEAEYELWPRAMGALLRASVENAAGNRSATIEALKTGIARCEEGDSIAYAVPARHRLGELLGGDEGAELVKAARAAFESWGARNPVQWLQGSFPGTWGPAAAVANKDKNQNAAAHSPGQ